MARRVAAKQRRPKAQAWVPAVDRTLLEVLEYRWKELGFDRELVACEAPRAKEPGRWDPPEALPGTGMFSGYRELKGEVMIVKMLRSLPWLYRPLRDAVRALGDGKSGPSRMDGCWACIIFAWVDSGEADVQPWLAETTPELWQACGFSSEPSYTTAQRRIVEAETVKEAFAETLHRLVQYCRKREPRIGHAVAIDATMAESNARLHKVTGSSVPTRIGELPLLASARMPTQTVDEIRRASNVEPPDVGPLEVGDYIDVTPDISIGVLGQKRVFQLKSGIYATRDPDAGVRAYIRGKRLLKWWHGYLLSQGIDHFSGLPLEAHGFRADINEHTQYPQVVEKAERTLGKTPYFVTTDKGMSIWSCFDWSVQRGITLVAPYRQFGGKAPAKAQATLDFDEHGIPFCRHCKGGTDQVDFFVKPPKSRNGAPRPVLRVRCAAPDRKECEGVQEWNCRRDPTRLLPVWRTNPAYTEARLRHSTLERAHTEARSRANAKPRHFETRSKRISLDLAVMRMNVYAIISWIRAGVINGWLGTPAMNPELEQATERQRQLDRQTVCAYVQHNVTIARLRRGHVGGGRIPHRTRGAPRPPNIPATS
jgi:hypothetical protein